MALAFDNLPANMQSWAYYSYVQNAKLFLLFFMFAYSLLYFFYFKKLEKETPFLSVKLFRLFSRVYSFIFLIFSPLFIIYLAPQSSLWDDLFLLFFVLVYSVAGLVILLGLTADVIYFGFIGFLLIIGIDVKNKKFERFLNKYIPRGLVYGKKGY